MSTFWSYPSTSPQTLGPHSCSISASNSCPRLGIPKSSDASLSEVNLTLPHTPRTCVTLKWYTCCDTGHRKGLCWIVWWRNRWALCVLCHLSLADSRMKTFAESTSYQPWSARYDIVSSIQSRPVHQSLCLSICRIYLTLVYVSQDASLDIRNGLCAVEWFSGAPQCQLSPTKLQTPFCGLRVPSWTSSVHSRWCHKSLSPAE